MIAELNKRAKKRKKMSKRAKRLRDTGSTLWKVKALSAWSKLVRQKGVCEACGRTDGVLNAHHILPKERYIWLAFLPINGVALCYNCHKAGRYSAHRNPLWFARWLAETKPEAYQWAMVNMESAAQPVEDFKSVFVSLCPAAEVSPAA